MLPVVNQFGEVTAYIYKKMLLDAKSNAFIGLIVGNCIYGNASGPIGKLFNNTIRSLDGRILGKIASETSYKLLVNDIELSNDTWRILNQVKDHVCPWIPELTTWSEKQLADVLGTNSSVGNLAMAG
jgi:hypothetical protein